AERVRCEAAAGGAACAPAVLAVPADGAAWHLRPLSQEFSLRGRWMPGNLLRGAVGIEARDDAGDAVAVLCHLGVADQIELVLDSFRFAGVSEHQTDGRQCAEHALGLALAGDQAERYLGGERESEAVVNLGHDAEPTGHSQWMNLMTPSTRKRNVSVSFIG